MITSFCRISRSVIPVEQYMATPRVSRPMPMSAQVESYLPERLYSIVYGIRVMQRRTDTIRDASRDRRN